MRGRRRAARSESIRRRRWARGAAAEAGEAQFYVQPVGAVPELGGLEVPDLLHREGRPWGDLAGSAELVRFAFEGGDCEGVFDSLVESTPLAPSSFSPGSFAAQLYLNELVRSCFPVRIGSESHRVHESLLVRILSAPPMASEDAEARQEVFRELAEQPPFREDLERFYLAARRLRTALEAAPSAEPNSVRRKLAVLVAMKDCIDALAGGFEGARSILGRLREVGTRMRGAEAYGQLAQLLDFDDHLSTVDVRVRLGSDGTIRGFGVLAMRENSANALLPGPVRRFFQRVSAFLRGYRYGESEVVVRLLERVFDPLVDDVVRCLALIGPVELYLAGLGFRDLAEAKGLSVSLPELVDADPKTHDGPDRVLEGLFNPLLFLQGIVPRPCDIPIPRHDALAVLTGPNSGGKTRLLQAIALSQLLGQAGTFVPARRARLVRAPGLFVSLVVDADAAQVEGRLGTELLRIRTLFEELEPGALAILDELCSGTNPMEGEAIFELVVSLLPRLQPQVFISTHFLGLAQRLAESPPVEQLTFLEVELDEDERPTFGFVPGVAKTSLAHKVAARLGVTRGELERLVERKSRRG